MTYFFSLVRTVIVVGPALLVLDRGCLDDPFAQRLDVLHEAFADCAAFALPCKLVSTETRSGALAAFTFATVPIFTFTSKLMHRHGACGGHSARPNRPLEAGRLTQSRGFEMRFTTLRKSTLKLQP